MGSQKATNLLLLGLMLVLVWVGGWLHADAQRLNGPPPQTQFAQEVEIDALNEITNLQELGSVVDLVFFDEAGDRLIVVWH